MRTNYNSAIGTFCTNIANDLTITINNMHDCLENKAHYCEYPESGEDGFDGLIPRSDRKLLLCTNL